MQPFTPRLRPDGFPVLAWYAYRCPDDGAHWSAFSAARSPCPKCGAQRFAYCEEVDEFADDGDDEGEA